MQPLYWGFSCLELSSLSGLVLLGCTCSSRVFLAFVSSLRVWCGSSGCVAVCGGREGHCVCCMKLEPLMHLCIALAWEMAWFGSPLCDGVPWWGYLWCWLRCTMTVMCRAVCAPLMQCRHRRPQRLPPQQGSGLEQGQELVGQPLMEQW